MDVCAAVRSVLRSSIAAMTEDSSGPRAAVPPSRLSTEAACRPRCSTTSTSSGSTASVTLGALQDNGIVTNAPRALPAAAFPTWKMGDGGDGFAVAHDGQNATKRLREKQRKHRRVDERRRQLRKHPPPWSQAGRRSNVYLAAVAVDPSTDGTVYASSNANLWQSTDSGRLGRRRRRFPGPRATWTSRRPTATMWSSPSEDRFWCRRTRSARSR